MLSTGVVPGRIRRAIGSRTACPYHCGPPRQHGTSARRDRKAALAQAQAQHLLNTLRMITIRKRRLDQSDKAIDDSAPLDLTRVATIALDQTRDGLRPVELDHDLLDAVRLCSHPARAARTGALIHQVLNWMSRIFGRVAPRTPRPESAAAYDRAEQARIWRGHLDVAAPIPLIRAATVRSTGMLRAQL